MAGERGSVTLPYVYATGLSLVLFVVVVNLVVHQYAHGALRAVVDEAARAGARTTATADAAVAACLRTGETTRAGLLGARLGAGATVACTVDDDTVTATAEATLRGWLAIVPDREVRVDATAAREFSP